MAKLKKIDFSKWQIFKKLTFGKVIFDRELTFGEGNLKNYIKQKLAIFTRPPPFSAEISHKKPTFPQ
ncbi:MAG: hypothetical protein II939_07165 [Bacteroidales bacterium]|nr:hypothetical protein [Bacteroidales bacterium]